MYIQLVKRGELERRLKALGWYPESEGGRHSVWSHPTKLHKFYIPRHPIINMNTARSILRDAER
jgi:predicted RNA binding protein YcfA (HicA-like mRNA interferase family)